MDAVLVLTVVVLVPILAGWALARWTDWPRLVVALIAGMPLPIVALVIILVDYVDVLHIPDKKCGFSCELDRALAPAVAMSTGVGLVIAVVIAFVTATIVRRRRR